MTVRILHPALDEISPYTGPCGCCGAGDARHRVYDAILERVTAGDHPEAVAWDYGATEYAVCVIRDEWPDAREEWEES